MNDGSSDTRTTTTRPRREPPASRLRAARLAKGLSQAELAARAGLSPGWISLLERTPAFLTDRTAHLLADVLDFSAQELRS
jgi:transcriptional regulator with XRE-family HTH domain